MSVFTTNQVDLLANGNTSYFRQKLPGSSPAFPNYSQACLAGLATPGNQAGASLGLQTTTQPIRDLLHFLQQRVAVPGNTDSARLLGKNWSIFPHFLLLWLI